MPFSNGVYTPPTGAENATAGKVIASATWNSIFTDLSTALTQLCSGTVPLLFVQIGPLPWVQANSYAGGSSGSSILAVRGTSGVPITSQVPTAIFQSVNNISTGQGGQTIYGSLIKLNNAALDHRGIWVEAVDGATGTNTGSSISGGRFTASLLQGTGGNGTGSTNVGLANVPYAFTIGAENQCWLVGTATEASTTFSTARFAAGVLSSCAGTKSADAGFLINPLGYTAGHSYITGFMVPTTGSGAGLDPVRDTAFRCDASCVNGLDFTRGTYSGFAIKASGFTVDNTGNATGASITTGNLTGSGSLSTSAPITVTSSVVITASIDSTYIFTTSSTLSPATITLPAASLSPGRRLNVLSQAPTAIVSAASNVVLLAGSGGTPGTPIIVSTSGKFAVLVAASTYWQVIESN